MAWLHPSYLWVLAGGVVLAVGLVAWAVRQRRQALEAFGDRDLVRDLAGSVRTKTRAVKAGLLVLAVALFGVALAGPRFGTTVREVERKGIDLVVALDVSQSMLAEDVAPNRLERARNEIKSLLGTLSGDRVGLVLFAGDGFVQCPLTTDYDAVRLFLDVAEPELIPTPGTDFEAAIDAALQAFRTGSRSDTLAPATENRSKALLIVSDGENHAGDVDRLRERAGEAGLTVFAAGVGERDGTPVPEMKNGRRVGLKRGPDGRIVRSKLEEASLTALSEEGAYFRIARTSSALSDLPQALNRLQRTSLGAEQFEDYKEMYPWPLAGGLVLLALALVLPDRRRSTASVSVRPGTE
jgi:Ca-activated chloride channel family protein